ncbi:MAG: ImmA/IrrE family metallo-endopeptidase, partial [Candidatus Tectomicrobia bacterium]|nr:ImmA/IrrE family metallo-endopeptidase [Candidatus Tectomicrobia bacterium]
TQAHAAACIEVARTTLVAMEKGQRAARIAELLPLAKLYDTSVNALLRRESLYVDLMPRFRKLPTCKEEASDKAARLLETLVQAEVELENLLGVVRPRNYPEQRPLLPGDVRTQAENDATELRHKLGLGLAPVHDMISLLELDIGIRVYIRPIDSSLSGLFAYDEQVGACMLLNASHPRERRAQSAAHELGHFVSSRQAPEVLYRGDQENSREERYANTFARAFLTPARTVMQRFQDITQGASHLTRRHLILLAYAFGVSLEAMVRRLEELGLTKKGTWDWFRENGGITYEQAKQVLGEAAVHHDTDTKNPTTLRLSLLATQAWRKELLSEGQLARLLRLDRVQLRQILDGVEAEGGDADGAPKLPH